MSSAAHQQTSKVFARKAIESSFLWSCGDIISQFITEKFATPDKKKGAGNWYDPKRTLRSASFGATVYTPLAFTWYHKIIPATVPGSTRVDLVKKVLADQLVFGPVLITSFYLIMPMFEFKNPADCVDRWKKEFFSTMQRNWMVWGPIQVFNFNFVSLQNRILVNNLVSIPWSGYLAWRNSSASASSSSSSAEGQK